MATTAAKAPTDSVVFTQDSGVPGETEFKEGKKYDLSPASAYRWVRRGRAQYADETKQAEFALSDGNTPPAPPRPPTR